MVTGLPGVAPSGFDVQGHRGARALRPENTLVGFAYALDLGVGTLEMDVGVTRDGQVVVSHDPALNPRVCRHADGRALAGERGPRLRDLTLAELAAFDCGSTNPDPRRFPEPPRQNAPGARIPTLAEVFELAQGRAGAAAVRFNVEIKSVPGSQDTLALEPFVRAVLAVVDAAGVRERTTIQAFDWQALVLVRQLAPDVRTAALLAPETLDASWHAGLDPAPLADPLALLEAARAFVDDFSPFWRQLVPGDDYLGRTVAEYRARGFRVVPWTVNDAETMRRLIALGVDGLISDRPDRLLEVLRDLETPQGTLGAERAAP